MSNVQANVTCGARETGRQHKETGNALNPYSKLADIVTGEVIFFHCEEKRADASRQLDVPMY